ncbi:hypothetical protein WOLCODRAFT_132036 [Wolfiporia cocos MD-104 SS10]|uniref:Uncharacterized protein n=1 Tax=Wolfiporia cocos (strain MD-104) TaxID=742152 RepID=A0A2H3JHG3_WOLCO|nr:hypothetical protein WOLCODRAFT_132036 [Wolfiporia cocos MD-104 SS10]
MSAILPPKKVIRALQSYKSNAPQELSFEKGDFFHVLTDARASDTWYEAHNPMTGARGLVPCHMFEEFQKGSKVRTPPVSPPTRHTVPFDAKNGERPVSRTPKPPTFFAVVMHDFTAERADELDAKSGDAITVVAQSNREWFVAKPIGRLGRPGLIPVSFVELRDPGTGQPVRDVMSLIDSGALPRVEEWKRAMLNYKANSISLGVLDDSTAASLARGPPPKHDPSIAAEGPSPPSHQQLQPPLPPSRPKSLQVLPGGILLSADVKSFHYEMREYWFRVHAIFQPYGTSGSRLLPPAKQLVLFRSYDDFHAFQVELLRTFPHEGGQVEPDNRILPFMPGPADHVDTEITSTRRVELDEYLHKLCELQQYARYILEHTVVRTFLALKPGDAEVEIESRTAEVEAMDRPSSTYPAPGDKHADDDYGADQMSRLQISEGANGHASDGSDYGDPDAAYDRDSYDHYHDDHHTPHRAAEQNLNTTEPLRPRSRTTPGHDRAGNSSNGHSSHASTSALQGDGYRLNGQSRTSVASSSHGPSSASARASQAGSTHTSRTSASGRSRIQSQAAYTPPISASNPQPAFIKIKIFDKAAEDLVAIRVHPKVTYVQLLEKVEQRLGAAVDQLRYKEGPESDFVSLENDEELRWWLDNTERYVLYAA